jgi:AcrB/AcrD/AcrF family
MRIRPKAAAAFAVGGREGQIVHLRDVARLELGTGDYTLRSQLDGKNAVGIGLFQAPGANALSEGRDRHHESAVPALSVRRQLRGGLPRGRNADGGVQRIADAQGGPGVLAQGQLDGGDRESTVSQ